MLIWARSYVHKWYVFSFYVAREKLFLLYVIRTYINSYELYFNYTLN